MKACILSLLLFLWPISQIAAKADTVYLPSVRNSIFAKPHHWARVTRVSDGATIAVTLDSCPIEGIKVRYVGIDTPERGECFWREAKDRNTALVAGQRVVLERDVSEFDSWNRLLRHVYLAEGTWVNGTLVREGYARVATYPPDSRYEAALCQLQTVAIMEGAGGWTHCGW